VAGDDRYRDAKDLTANQAERLFWREERDQEAEDWFELLNFIVPFVTGPIVIAQMIQDWLDNRRH
jgi:hypothetical protein